LGGERIPNPIGGQRDGFLGIGPPPDAGIGFLLEYHMMIEDGRKFNSGVGSLLGTGEDSRCKGKKSRSFHGVENGGSPILFSTHKTVGSEFGIVEMIGTTNGH
jgi:hypothetical protein